MNWRAEVSALMLRAYLTEAGPAYQRRDQFIAVASCKLMGTDAWIEGALRVDGHPLKFSDWAGLARLLREQHGIEVIRGEHRGKPLAIETNRAR